MQVLRVFSLYFHYSCTIYNYTVHPLPAKWVFFSVNGEIQRTRKSTFSVACMHACSKEETQCWNSCQWIQCVRQRGEDVMRSTNCFWGNLKGKKLLKTHRNKKSFYHTKTPEYPTLCMFFLRSLVLREKSINKEVLQVTNVMKKNTRLSFRGPGIYWLAFFTCYKTTKILAFHDKLATMQTKGVFAKC